MYLTARAILAEANLIIVNISIISYVDCSGDMFTMVILYVFAIKLFNAIHFTNLENRNVFLVVWLLLQFQLKIILCKDVLMYDSNL